jgi:hypothetical protein
VSIFLRARGLCKFSLCKSSIVGFIEKDGGPFELISERHHPIVRIESRRIASRNRILRIFMVLVPVLFSIVVLALLLSERQAFRDLFSGYMARWYGPAFFIYLALWPLICFVGAAISTSGAVLEEISSNTAMQLVLTPLPARPLAAAKILPRVKPFLLGILCSLPIYIFCSIFVLTVALPWPLRMVLLFGDFRGGGSPWFYGIVMGLGMGLMDLLIVWCGALWGAASAIAHRSLLKVIVYMGWRLLLLGLQVTFCALPALIPTGLVYFSIQGGGGTILGSLLGILGLALSFAILLALMWIVVLENQAQRVLLAFQGFDRLANVEFPGMDVRSFSGYRRFGSLK